MSRVPEPAPGLGAGPHGAGGPLSTINSRPHLARALAAQPDPPCIKHGCGFLARCAAGGLACDSFRHYVDTGKVVAPQHETLQRFDFRQEVSTK